jgi:hypothetical protein
MTPYYEKLRKQVRSDCRRISSEIGKPAEGRTMYDVNEEICSIVAKKYPKESGEPRSTDTIYQMWKNKNYGKKKKGRRHP